MVGPDGRLFAERFDGHAADLTDIDMLAAGEPGSLVGTYVVDPVTLQGVQ